METILGLNPSKNKRDRTQANYLRVEETANRPIARSTKAH